MYTAAVHGADEIAPCFWLILKKSIMFSYTLMLLSNSTHTDKNDRMHHLFIVAITVLLSVWVGGYTLVSTPPHMLRLGVPPPLVGPLPDTRESDPELGEEPQLHGTARTSLDPGWTGERETPPWDWSCAQVLDYFTGTEAVLVRYTSDVWHQPNLTCESNYPNKRDERADLCWSSYLLSARGKSCHLTGRVQRR